MATAPALTAPAGGKQPEPRSSAAEVALQPSVPPVAHPENGRLVLSAAQSRLPVELDVSVEVRDFRVRNLLALEPGQVIESRWTHGEDLPLAAGKVLLAWSEFEVVDAELGVRITRLP